MNYWSLFKDSFGKLLVPALWVFGLLAALGGSFNFRTNIGEVAPMTDVPFGLRQLLGDAFSNAGPAIVAGLVLSFALMIFGAFGQAALMKLINRLENGEHVTVGMGFDDGGRRLLHLLAVRILLALPLLIIGAAIAGSFLVALSGVFSPTHTERLFSFGDLGRLLGLAGLALIVSLPISGISLCAERAVVIEELPIFQAIALGTRLFLTQIGDIIIIALLFIVVAIGLGLLFACVLIPVIFASASFGSVESGGAIFDVQLTGATAAISIIVGLLVGLLGSIFNTSVWTLAYRHWRTAQVVRPAAPPDAL